MKYIADPSFSLRAQVGAQEPFVWIDAAGARLAVTRRGKGIPLVCLHAIGHGARDFEALAARVGDMFEVIAIDWPGQGRSPPDTHPPSAARYAEILEAALDSLSLERAILLGNSIGGAAALRVAAAKPERVSALVLCDSGGLVPITPVARFFIYRFVAFFRAGERGRRWFARAFQFYYRRMVLPGAPAHEQRERIIAAGYETAGVLRAAWESFAQAESDTRHLAPKVQVPVWLAWAKDDRIISWAGSQKAASTFPYRKVAMFRGGHAAFLEDPDRFAEGLSDFVRAFDVR